MSETSEEKFTFHDISVNDITAVLEDSKGRTGHVGWDARIGWGSGKIFDKDEWHMAVTFTKKRPFAAGDMVVGTPGWRPTEPARIVHIEGDRVWVDGPDDGHVGFITRKERIKHARPEDSE